MRRFESLTEAAMNGLQWLCTPILCNAVSSTIQKSHSLVSARGTSLTVALSLVFWALGAGSFAEASEKDLSPADRELFEREIRPALAETCSVCHSAELAQAELRLDSREGWEAGGKSGPAIIPGDPDGSPLIRAIRQEGPELPMPVGSPKLSPRQIRAFERWVLMGAPDPRGAPLAEPPGSDEAHLEWEKAYKQRIRWWSFAAGCPATGSRRQTSRLVGSGRRPSTRLLPLWRALGATLDGRRALQRYLWL